jgi:riboflavin kinase / FMN adenylyltransferase
MMKLINNIYDIKSPLKNAVVTIGNFDGVHKGHQAIIHQVIEKAESIEGTSVAITFEPHPIRILKKNGWPPLITSFNQKKELISHTGIDVLACIQFDEKFASISAFQFVKEILIDRIGMKAIVIGKDYAFGKDREGNTEFLKKYALDLGFEVIVANWIPRSYFGSKRISSTQIREVIMAGEVDEAFNLLGRFYQIEGTVVSGRKRGGQLLGFPTANLNLCGELCPKTGIYAVTALCKEKLYSGVANIGYSPTFDDHIFTVEVHLLDFKEDIYGENLRVNFISRIRDEKKFSGVEELSHQILNDIQTARTILSRFKNN